MYCSIINDRTVWVHTGFVANTVILFLLQDKTKPFKHKIIENMQLPVQKMTIHDFKLELELDYRHKKSLHLQEYSYRYSFIQLITVPVIHCSYVVLKKITAKSSGMLFLILLYCVTVNHCMA